MLWFKRSPPSITQKRKAQRDGFLSTVIERPGVSGGVEARVSANVRITKLSRCDLHMPAIGNDAEAELGWPLLRQLYSKYAVDASVRSQKAEQCAREL